MTNTKVNKAGSIKKNLKDPGLTTRIRSAIIDGCQFDSGTKIILKQTRNGVLGVVKSQSFRNMRVSARQNKINQSLKNKLSPDDLKKIIVILTHAI